MTRKAAIVIGFLLLLALVAKPVWEGREQWHFGQGFDDSVYFLTAKALATGQGYRVISLPGQPWAVKYPPLYPLYLSIAWRLNPAFPANLRIAAVMQAMLLPVFLALLLALLRQLGLSWRRTLLVAATTLVTLQMVVLTITLFSELLCMCLLFGAMLLIGRSAEANGKTAAWMALTGGLLAGLAYLSRNAALPLLAAAPVFYFLRNRRRLGLYFLALALPIALSWHVWTIAYGRPGFDPTNASYINEYSHIIRLSGVWGNFLKQLGMLSGGIAENYIPGFVDTLAGLPLYHVIFAAAIAGGIRIGLRRNWPVYLIFTALYLVMILFWWFQGLTRLVIPVWPMLLAGVAEEAGHFAALCEKTMARSPSWSSKPLFWQRMPRWVLIALGTLIMVRGDSVCWRRISMAMSEERELRLQDREAFRWIAGHLQDDTLVLAWKDTTLHLYTGASTSRGLYIAVTPQTPDIKAFAASFAMLPEKYCRGMLVLLPSDIGEGAAASGLDPFRAAAESLAGAKLEFSSSATLIYSFPIKR